MVSVTIKIESNAVNDPYARYHGKAIDDALDASFWETQPDKVLGIQIDSFSDVQIVDLPVGDHYIIYGISVVPDLYWYAKIYVNDALKSQGAVDVYRFLRADFTVGEGGDEEEEPTFWDRLVAMWNALPWWQKALLIIGSVGAVGAVVIDVAKKR